MRGLTFDTRDLKRFKATLNKVEKLPQKVVTTSVNKGTTVVRKSIRGEVPVRTGALKRGIIRGAEHPQKKVNGKKVNDLKFDPAMNDIFQKPIKNPGEAGGKRPTGYYPASMECGFLTRSKGGGYSYVQGHHFMRDGSEASRPQFNQTVIKDMTAKLEKEWQKSMEPEELIESTLSRLPGLARKVFPLEGLKDAAPPFVFYLQIAGDEETALDGLTGLRSASFEINCVGRSYAELKVLANRVRPALQGLQGMETPGLSVQRAVVRQASPDLKEREVSLYRRMYILQLDYQEE